MEWTLSPNGFIECNTIVAPGGATILGQGTFGLIRLPSNQRSVSPFPPLLYKRNVIMTDHAISCLSHTHTHSYTQVYFDVVSSQETAVPGTATGDDNYGRWLPSDSRPMQIDTLVPTFVLHRPLWVSIHLQCIKTHTAFGSLPPSPPPPLMSASRPSAPTRPRGRATRLRRTRPSRTYCSRVAEGQHKFTLIRR